MKLIDKNGVTNFTGVIGKVTGKYATCNFTSLYNSDSIVRLRKKGFFFESAVALQHLNATRPWMRIYTLLQ